MQAKNDAHEAAGPRFPVLDRARWQVLGFSLGVLLAAMLMPQTRPWMVRQANVAFAGGSGSLIADPPGQIGQVRVSETLRQKYARAAAALRTDVGAQTAYGTLMAFQEATHPRQDAGYSADVMETRRLWLRDAIERFPNDPLPYAAYLRYMVVYSAHLYRPESYIFGDKPFPVSGAQNKPVLNRPKLMAEFLETAQTGERLDPRNAFFPFMEAIGRYGDFHDKEGLAAISQAAERPEWREYTTEEIRGTWRLNTAAFGRNSALERLGAAYGMVFPHISQYRVAILPPLYQAIACEIRGDFEGGLAIRGRLMRLAVTIHDRATTNIGAVVAESMLFTAADNTSHVIRPLGDLTPERRKILANAYTAYLKEHGRQAEADWFNRHAVLTTETLRSADMAVHRPLATAWAGSLYALVEIALLAILGVGAFAYAYTRRFDMRSENGLIRPVALGIAIGTGGILILNAMEPRIVGPGDILICSVILLVPLLVLCTVARGERPLFLSAYAAFAVLGALTNLTSRMAAGAFHFVAAMTGLVAENGSVRSTLWAGKPEQFVTLWMLALPALVAFLALVVHGARFVFRPGVSMPPVLTSAVRTFAASTVPVIAICLTLYSADLFAMARQEAIAAGYLESLVTNEPVAIQYYEHYYRPVMPAGQSHPTAPPPIERQTTNKAGQIPVRP